MTCGYAADIVACVVEKEFRALKSPPARVTLPDIQPRRHERCRTTFILRRHITNAARKTLGKSVEQDVFAGVEPGDKTLDIPDSSFTGPF